VTRRLAPAAGAAAAGSKYGMTVVKSASGETLGGGAVKKKIRTADLHVGMYVSEVHSSWLNAPLVMSDFMINSQKDIDRLAEYEISLVSIDTSRGLDVGQELEVAAREPAMSIDNTFEIPIRAFWINRASPVDLYFFSGGKADQILKTGLVFSEEVFELFRDMGVTIARAPNGQKEAFDQYLHDLERETESYREKGFTDQYCDPEKVKRYQEFKLDYHPIHPLSLVGNTVIEFTLYRRHDDAVRVLLGKNSTIDPDDLRQWIEEDYNLLIHKEDKLAYQIYLVNCTRNSEDDLVRAAFVRENSKLIVESLAENPRSKQLMAQTKQSVLEMTAMVIERPTTFYSLIKINNYDYYTFTHSVNVAILALAMALMAGVNDKKELADLGLGTLLHDLGKSRVDRKLINKPGRLTDDEYRIITSHVQLGYEMLKGNPAVSELAMIPLLQHHEKLSGSGYPRGLRGDEIHLLGRIAGIIDIYDALTTERVYRKAFKPYDALTLIFKGRSDFDEKLLEMLVHMLGDQVI